MTNVSFFFLIESGVRITTILGNDNFECKLEDHFMLTDFNPV